MRLRTARTSVPGLVTSLPSRNISPDVGSISACYFWAQPHIAAWSETHPKYKIMKWTCANPAADGEPI